MIFCERLPTSRNPKGRNCSPFTTGFQLRNSQWDSAGLRSLRSRVVRYNNDDESTTGAVELAGGSVHLVTTMEQWEQMTSEANKNGKIVAVNFSAAWCNPCRKIAPTYRELSDKYPSILFITVDVDELAEFSTSWDIKATPTFFFLREGRQFDKFVGANKDDLQKKMMLIADQSSMRSPN